MNRIVTIQRAGAHARECLLIGVGRRTKRAHTFMDRRGTLRFVEDWLQRRRVPQSTTAEETPREGSQR